MANPQCENGHIRIATTIYEAFCKIRINGEARQVLDFIIRKTYGYHKKKDRISLSQFEKGTGLKRSCVCKAINKLKNMKLIVQIQNDDGSIYEFNKNYDDWEVVPKKGLGSPHKGTSPKRIEGSPHKGNRVVPIKGHTIDNYTKDIITKDIPSEQSSQSQKIMEVFYRINPTLNWGNKTSRKACDEMIKKFGLDGTIKMAEQIIAIQGQLYAPVATTPYQMKEKLAQFKIYFDSQKNKKPKVSVIS